MALRVQYHVPALSTSVGWALLAGGTGAALGVMGEETWYDSARC